jgi:hypothetical protein
MDWKSSGARSIEPPARRVDPTISAVSGGGANMNEKAEEYGLLITGVSYDDIRRAKPSPLPEEEQDPDLCVEIYRMAVETHPWDIDLIHISFLPGHLFYGPGELPRPIPRQTPRAQQIRRWFRRHLPKAKLKWDIIRTER